jgi:putative addiction module component (TIGR02574 family)
MSDAAQQLLEEALRLSIEERSKLIEKLIQSVDEEEASLSPEEWERVWTAELMRRNQQIDKGEVELIDGDEALRRVRTSLTK